MATSSPAKDPHPGTPFAKALELLRERFPDGNLTYEPVGGDVLVSLPLRKGGAFRAALTWQQAKYLAHSRLGGDDLRGGQLPPDWPE
jgi:hypothetical protein